MYSKTKSTPSTPTTPRIGTRNSSPPNIKENWCHYKKDNILAYWVPKDSIKAKRRQALKQALKENMSVSLNLYRSEDRLGCDHKFNTPPGPSLLGKRKAKSMPGHRTKRLRHEEITCVTRLKF